LPEGAAPAAGQARPAPTVFGAPPGHAPQAPRAKKRRLWPFIAGGALLLLVGGVALAWGPIARHLAQAQAAKRGVILAELDDVDVGWGSVTLKDFRFELDDVEGIAGTGKELTVELDGLTPTRLEANEIDIELVGSAAALAVAISEWTGAHPDLVRIPTDVDDVGVSWRESEGGPVWLRISGGSIEPLKKGARLAADHTEVLGFSAGAAGAVWDGDEATARLGFGIDDLDEAPVTIEVENLKEKPRAKISLRPTPLDKLAGPMGMFLPIKGITVSADADLRYAGKKKATILGHLDAKLAGFTPPMPKEAQGFVFGDTTQLSTDVEVSPDRRTVSLKKAKVTHGDLTLEGEGTITRSKSSAAIDLSLVGHVSCQALAKAAIKAGLGDRLGGLAERLASGAVTGSVEVKLHIVADSGSLLRTRIDRSLGVGCGITWPALPDMPEIPKIPGLPELPPIPFKPF
jgi:hypothetical protein